MLAGASSGSAAFVEGVERFDGSVVDTDTWSVVTGQATLTQYNAVTLDCSAPPVLAGIVEMTTRSLRVGVGEFVRADIAIPYADDWNPSNPIAVESWLRLTSRADSQPANAPRYYLELQQAFGPVFTAYGGYLEGPRGVSSNLNTAVGSSATLRFQIDRLTAGSARFSVIDLSDRVIRSKVVAVPEHADPLYIALGAWNTKTIFDNVTVGNVPEPVATAGLAAGLLALVMQRRR